MVDRFFKILYREVRGLHEAAYLLGFFALLSQILALVRDRILAHVFGAGTTLDLYYASFKIPDLIFVLVASIVSAYVLIPYISERLEDKERLREFVSSLFSAFSIFMIIVGGIAFVLAPSFVSLLFPGFNAENQEVLTTLTRIMLLQPLLLGASNFFASLAQVHHKFIIYGVSPLLYNIGIIVGIIGLYPVLGVPGLVWGVVLGALMHLLIQIPFILKEGYMPRLTWNVHASDVKSVMLTSLPRTLALSLQQIVLLVMVSIGSVLAVGSISIFNFSYNLQSVPLAIIGASYSVAAFPTLSRLISKKDEGAFVVHVATALKHILFWSVPAVFFFVVLRAQFVRVVLGSGSFDWADTRLTAAALALFAVSLPAQAIVLLLVRAYYAAGMTWKPFWITLGSSLVSIFSAILFLLIYSEFAEAQVFVESLLRVEGIPGTEVLMLPLGFSTGMLINALLLLAFFERDFGCITRAVSRMFGSVIVASFLGSLASYGVLLILAPHFDLDTFIGIFSQGLIAGVAGLLVWILVLYLLRSAELKEILKGIHGKIWKADVVFPGE